MNSVSTSLPRFALIGCLATGLHVGVLALLVESLGMSPVAASIPAFLLAMVTSYAMNRSWSFARPGRHAVQAPRYFIVALAGLALNAAIMGLVVDLLELDYRVGLALVVAVLPAVSFLLNRQWTFALRQST